MKKVVEPRGKDAASVHCIVTDDRYVTIRGLSQ